MKLLRRRIFSGILAVVMMVSSLQFSGTTVYAEDLSLSAVADNADSGEPTDVTDKTDSDEAADTAEQADFDESADTDGNTGSGEPADVIEQADSEEPADTAEPTNSEEPTADVELQSGDDIEESEAVNEIDSDNSVYKDEIDLSGIYQFGGAPTEEPEVESPSFSVEGDFDIEEINGLTVEEYIYNELLKRNTNIDVSAYKISYSKDKASRIISGVINEHPELYYVVKGGMSYNPYEMILTQYEISYNDDLNDTAFQNETRAALSVVKDDMTDLQKAIVLHDYLAVNCEYDYEKYLAEPNGKAVPPVSHSAYGALVNRIAVCDGYALAYKYLLNQLKINCYMVNSEAMAHAWNLIELDGKYYQVDVTWDDPTWDLVGRARHAYMFCSDDVFKDSDHKHKEWSVTVGSNVVDYKAVDTRYDNAFWTKVDSPLVLAGNDWNDCYFTYFDSQATIHKTKLSDIVNLGTAICDIDIWPVWEDKRYHYTTAYSGLFQNNNRLYYNDTTSICSVNFDGSGKRTEFTPDISNVYIYGSAFCQGKVLYSLHQDPNFKEKETVLVADMNIQEEGSKVFPVESVTLDRYTLTLVEGGSAVLNAAVKPDYATNPAVTWSSSDTLVATVNNGTVTAVGTGECTIKATADGTTAECKVTVSKKIIDVTSITLNKTTLELEIGDTETLRATVLPDNATNKTVIWRSNNDSVATVSGGTVTAVGEGTCYITANAGVKETGCLVTVTKKVIPVESISLDKSEIELKTGDTQTLNATVLPIDAEDKTVTWSSSKPSVATVSNGTVTAVGVGECTITAAAGDKTAECIVTVIPRVIAVENVVLDRSSLKLEVGEVIKVNAVVTPDNATDKTVNWISSDNAIATVNGGEVTAVNTGECTITATAGDKSAVCNIVVAEFAPADCIASGISQKIRWFIDKEGKLTVKGSGNYDVSAQSGKAPWYAYKNSIISAEINVTDMTDASYMFESCENLASVDMSRFDTDKVANMQGMFVGCYGLTDINWGNLDTAKVTDMSYMFSQCVNLANLDLSCFNTGSVKNMANMFDSCSSLSSLDISSFRTDNVTNISFMFSGCLGLTDLDLTNFTTSKVTDIRGMFSSCISLSSLDLSGFDMAALTRDDDNMLGGCTKLATINTPRNLSKSVTLPTRINEVWQKPDGTEIMELPINSSESIIITRNKKEIIYDNDIASGNYGSVSWVIDKDGKLTVSGSGDFAAAADGSSFSDKERAPWYSHRDLIVSADVNVSGVTDASYMFYDCENLTTINLSGFTTSSITNMSSMFAGCSSLTSLSLSGFDTSKVTDMDSMFAGCSSLTSLNLSGFNTGSVTGMNSMFSGCSGLASLDLSGFNTSNVTGMNSMFGGCSSLQVLGLDDFNTSQVKDIASMFNNCSVLTSLDLGNFDLGSVEETKVSGVLAGCTKLASIKTPINLGCRVALPVENGYVWQQPDEKEITVLPTGLNDSMEISKVKITLTDPFIAVTKIKTSYECNDIINLDDLTVEYHDERGTVTEVFDYSDNADEIDMLVEGTKTLIITYRGLTDEVALTVTKKQEDDDNKDDDKDPENKEGLKVELALPNRTHTYTGYAVTPAIKVTNNKEPLVEGVDYTVKYTNNIKASEVAKIVVTGKGNLSGSASKEFAIKAKLLDNSDVSADDNTLPKVEGKYITVVEGSKAAPVLLYDGKKLTAKDFKFADDKYKTYKWKKEDNNTEVTVSGQGNFGGSLKMTVIVIPKAEQKQYKLKVALGNVKNITYNGQPQNIDNLITVSTPKMPEGLIPGVDYTISYPKDITSAGVKKFTVTGISGRCIGSVTKSYTIKPAKGGSLKVNGVKDSYGFISAGVTFDKEEVIAKYGEVVVKYEDKDGNISEPLTKGVDYKITYSKNKKAGTANYTVTGLGSYKGNKKTDKFNIAPAVLCNNEKSGSGMTSGLKIVVADKVFKKPGVYKSAPYVSIDGVLLKASNYKLEYYLENPLEKAEPIAMDKNHKVTNGNVDTTVWVKIIGKGNYATTDDTCYAVASYKVRSKAESEPGSSYDLSKATVSFQNKEGKPVKKIEFTGNPIDSDDITVVVTYKIGREKTVLNEGTDYKAEFVNNVCKGKATVVITAPANQTRYVGSKTASFSITANNVKNTIKWFS